VTFRVIIGAFAVAFFLFGSSDSDAFATTDMPAVAEATAHAGADAVSAGAESLDDALAFLSGTNSAADGDTETDEFCADATVAPRSNLTQRPARALRYRWKPRNAGAPPLPPPEGSARNQRTPFEVTQPDAKTRASGRVGGPDSMSSPNPAFFASSPHSVLPGALPAPSAAARDASPRRSPAETHRVLLNPDIPQRQPTRAPACASERQRRFVHASTSVSTKSERWGTS
jgi:hypothetical protein